MGKNNHVGRKHSDTLKVSAITRYDLTHQLRATAREFDIPPTTLSTWLTEREKGTLDIVDLEERIEHTKKELLDNTKTAMSKALQVIIDKVDNCNAYQAATIYGILFDKAEKMEGAGREGQGSTTNNFIIGSLGEDEAMKLLTRTFDRMKGKDIIEVDGQVDECS